MIVAPPARHVGWLLGAAAVAASAAVQWPALGNSFRHDDFLLFYQAANLPVADFLLHTHGGHLLMTRNAIHLACTTLFGLEPLPYMALGLATHLANVALLFVLVSRLAGRPAVAALAAGLWGMSPVNQSSVSWPTAYGNVVATMLVLAVAVGLAGVVARRRPPGALAPLGWATGLLVAATCFGTGVAATVAAPAMAWLVVPPEAGRRRIVVTLGAATAVLVVAYAILRPPHTESAVDLARLPPLYVAQLFGSLVSFGVSALLLGPLATNTDVGVALGPLRGQPLDAILPVVSAFAAASALAAVALLSRAPREARRHALAFALLACAAYGLVAVARWQVTPMVGLAWMGAVVRYHYLPTAALAVVLALSLGALASRLAPAHAAGNRSGAAARPGAAWGAPVAVLLALALAIAPFRSAARRVDFQFSAGSQQLLDRARAAIDAALAAGGADGAPRKLRNADFGGVAMIHLFLEPAGFPGLAAVYVLSHPARDDAGVLFVEDDEALVRLVREQPRSRIARLLVTPAEAGGDGQPIATTP